jgi:hypothetical protein
LGFVFETALLNLAGKPYGEETMKVIDKRLSVLVAASYLMVFGICGPAHAGEKTVVPTGTLVLARPRDTVSPKTCQNGDTIDFIVIQDVKVKEKIVIKSGALARGQVTGAKKASIVGMPAKIAVELQTVEAVDGSMIPIRASKSMEGDDKMVLTVILAFICLPLILIPGGSTQISSGTTFDAFTIGMAEVTVEN